MSQTSCSCIICFVRIEDIWPDRHHFGGQQLVNASQLQPTKCNDESASHPWRPTGEGWACLCLSALPPIRATPPCPSPQSMVLINHCHWCIRERLPCHCHQPGQSSTPLRASHAPSQCNHSWQKVKHSTLLFSKGTITHPKQWIQELCFLSIQIQQQGVLHSALSKMETVVKFHSGLSERCTIWWSGRGWVTSKNQVGRILKDSADNLCHISEGHLPLKCTWAAVQMHIVAWFLSGFELVTCDLEVARHQFKWARQFQNASEWLFSKNCYTKVLDTHLWKAVADEDKTVSPADAMCLINWWDSVLKEIVWHGKGSIFSFCGSHNLDQPMDSMGFGITFAVSMQEEMTVPSFVWCDSFSRLMCSFLDTQNSMQKQSCQISAPFSASYFDGREGHQFIHWCFKFPGLNANNNCAKLCICMWPHACFRDRYPSETWHNLSAGIFQNLSNLIFCCDSSPSDHTPPTQHHTTSMKIDHCCPHCSRGTQLTMLLNLDSKALEFWVLLLDTCHVQIKPCWKFQCLQPPFGHGWPQWW